MAPDLPDSLEGLSHSDLIGAVRDLVGEFTRLRAEHEKVLETLAKLRIEHQAVKDELARYKKLPPRPPQKPSGMEKATDLPDAAGGRDEGRAFDAPARQQPGQAEDRPDRRRAGRGAGGIAPQGL